MSYLKGIIKSVITSQLSFLIEDFTENDIIIDQWNGRIQKENVKIKKDAFEWITKALVGTPCTVVQGYIKKLQIDVPWSELQSRPLEVTIEDLHVILTSTECYDRNFVKNTLIELKQRKVKDLLKLVEEQFKKGKDGAIVESGGSQGFLSRIQSVIMENLRINIRNVHVRFEDNFVSRRDQAFNFGIISESITYSMTNNRFVRAFLNIDDKLQEQRSFSMLKVLKFAMYWNSNAQDNWTKSREFINLAAQGTIAFSKNHIEILMSKHNASKQDYNYSSVFLVQPTDISVKFRTNLAPSLQPQIPVNTTAFEVSDVTLSVDEEVLKDIQYVSKFFAWHAMSINKNGYLKLRPAYNIPVKGNARAYWRYAIKATIYLMRKEKQDKNQLAKKRHQEMVELSEIYRLDKINEYLSRVGSKDRHFKIEDKVQNVRFRRFRNQAGLKKRMQHLEYKLTPEQIVVAIKKGEKESTTFILDYQQRTGWRSWVPSMLKTSYWYGGNQDAAKAAEEGDQDGKPAAENQEQIEEAEFQETIEELLAKTKQFQEDKSPQEESKIDDSDTGEYDEARQRTKQVSYHMTLQVPLIELLVVNKLHGAYNAKCFMSTAIQDLFYQKVDYKDGNYQQLFSLRSFDVIDKLVQSPKFQRTVYKGPLRQAQTQQVPDLQQRVMQRFGQQTIGLNLGGGRFGTDHASSLHEVEEESNPNVNNGLPRVRYFQDINRSVSEAEQFFFMFQMTATATKRQLGGGGAIGAELVKPVQCKKYKIDTMLNHTVLFYNRTLISRAQTFFHQATVSKSQNAAAEADFDSKIAAMQKATEEKVSNLLEHSEFEVVCAMKGIEVLVPDDISFQESKFMLLKTGHVMARSRRPPHSLPQKDQMTGFDIGPQQPTFQQSQNDSLFTNTVREQIQKFSKTSDASLDQLHVGLDSPTQVNSASKIVSDSQMLVLRTLERKGASSSSPSEFNISSAHHLNSADPKYSQEDYCLTVFDIQLLYLPSFNFLEAIEYNEISKEEIEKRYSLLKRTDLQIDFAKVLIEQQSKGKASTETIAKPITLVKAGLSIANIDCKMTTKEVKDIKFFVDKFLKYHKDLDKQVQEELIRLKLEAMFRQNINRSGNQTQMLESLNLQAQQAHIRELQSDTAIFNASQSLHRVDSQEAPVSSSKAISTIQSFKSCQSEDFGSSEDEFFDAYDHFDNEILDFLNMNQSQQQQQQNADEPLLTDGQAQQQSRQILLTSIQEEPEEVQDDAIVQEQSKQTSSKFSSTIAICASLNIGKLRFQILEASDIQEELVRNLKERLQSGYNNEPIELSVQTKGLPFLNFEVSKVNMTMLLAPSLIPMSLRPQNVTDLYLQTVSIHDFCLMNQEKVSQPQILFRSSNYGVNQAFTHASINKDRLGSFDKSNSLQGSRSHGGKHRYVDLEEEDNMAMADQGIDEIEDHCIRVVLGTLQSSQFEIQHTNAETSSVKESDDSIEVEEEMTLEEAGLVQNQSNKSHRGVISIHKKISDETKVEAEVDIGHLEGEITEHSIRKVMECLIQDFPLGNSSGASATAATAANEEQPGFDESMAPDKTVILDDEDDEVLDVTTTRHVTAKVRFDGLNYKMRLRKEETVMKIIDLAVELTDSSTASSIGEDRRHMSVDLTDFQVLHQNNELLFKHSFNYMDKQDSDDDDDKSINLPGQMRILSFSIDSDKDLTKVETKLDNFLFICESKAVLQIIQNVNTLKTIITKTVVPRQAQRKSAESGLKQDSLKKPKLEVKVAVNDCHLQMPVAESKNSLFFELNGLTFSYVVPASSSNLQQSGQNSITAGFKAIDIYVAKQVNQISKYYLIRLHESSAQAHHGSNGYNSRLEFALGVIRLTMNENYLLFLASLIEHHFNDVQALINFSKQLATPVAQQTDPDLVIQSQASEKDVEPLDQAALAEMSKNSPFLKSILKLESMNETHILSLAKVTVNSISFEWVFGLGFDDHEENYVTLSNRNFSKLILDQFDKQQNVHSLLEVNHEVYSDMQERQETKLIDSTNRPEGGIKKSFSKANLQGQNPPLIGKQKSSVLKEDLQSQATTNYEKLTLCFQDIQFERAKALENVFTNLTCRQIVIDQRSPSLKQAYPILLLRPRSVPKAVSLQSTQSNLKAQVSFFDLRVCQRTVTVISNLAKDIYSCKNVIKRGKKRRFFKALFKKSNISPEQMHEELDAQSFEMSVDLRKVRVVFYDSDEVEAKKANETSKQGQTPAGSFVRGLQAQATNEFEDDQQDQVFFKPGSLLTVETRVCISNLKPVKPQDDESNHDSASNDSQEGEGYQPDRQLNAKIANFSIFTNTRQSSLGEVPQQDQRLMLLYPTDVSLSQQFYSQKNLQMIEIGVSLIEFETSFKQVFMYQLLFKKIEDSCKPVTQIFEHRDSQISMKKKAATHQAGAGAQRDNKEEQRSPKSGVLLSMHMNSIYFTLIKETVADSFTPYGQEMNCMPMLSLEIKWLELRQKTQITGLQQTDVTFPLELYYFNQKLNFFEPAVERVLFKAQTELDVNGNTKKNLTVDDVLNLNFSVALYENMFVLMENLNHERENYKKIVEQAERENLMASLRTMNGEKPAQVQKSAAAASSIYGGANRTEAAFIHQSTSLNFIKNKTGELLLFKSGRQPAFTEMQANETLPLDFARNHNNPAANVNLLSAEDNGSKGLFDGVASSEMQPDSDVVTNNWPESSSDEDSEPDVDDISNFVPYAQGGGFTELRGHLDGEIGQKPRSMYRRGKFKFKKSEPNRVILQVLIQHGKDLERTPSFEINFDSLSCQRVFLDENRQLYVICQIQNKDGQKFLIVRSPMQVTNNLQIPIEVQLNNSVVQQGPPKRSSHHLLSTQQDEEESKGESRKNLLHRQGNFDFCMVIKPEQSMIIPLQACNFKSVQIRPLVPLVGKSASSMYQQESQFEWSKKANICLLQDEREIFEQKPVILCSKMTRNNLVVDRNNNQVFFALNANTYSIRSYIDFNTQQTDFISLRYLSITAPFTIQNLIPVPITILFKNIERLNEQSAFPTAGDKAQNPSKTQDKQVYNLELKHNSSLQVLYLNPLGNFDFSLAIPGYDASNYVKLKLEQEEDYELCSDLSQTNYLDAVGLGMDPTNNAFSTPKNRSSSRPRTASGPEDGKKNSRGKDQDDAKPDNDIGQLLQTAQFRFVKQKKLLMQLCSQFQSQFNICANIAFVQGFYHISFYAKYWFLNNTQMPLQAQVAQQTFSFPTLDLPYLSLDFDFDTTKQFLDRDYGQTKGKKVAGDEDPAVGNPKLQRKDSNETFKTETVTVRESKAGRDEEEKSMTDGGHGSMINYRRLKNQIQGGDANEREPQKGGLLRVKPWEAYRYSESRSKGLLAALSQEDIDRVSSIYFTQEMIKEEEKGEETEYVTARGDQTQTIKSDAFLTAQTHSIPNDDTFVTAMSNNQRQASSGGGAQDSIVQSSQRIAPKIAGLDKKPSKNVQFNLDRVENEDSVDKKSYTMSNSLQDRNNALRQKYLTTSGGGLDLLRAERMTKFSKTSIQMTNFQHQLNEKQAVPLNHTVLSDFNLYEAPLKDKDQLKRVILFSDVPIDESATSQVLSQSGESGIEQQNLLLRICDSEWTSLPFDLNKLQSEPIRIKDINRKPGQPQSMFELVSVVTFLPQPFSFSKLVCFQPRFLMVNRTFHTLYVVQSQCEELGTFKIFPQETSVFHWTDALKPLEVCVKLDEHEYSGNLRIDGIGEFNLRLKNIQEQDSTILNVSISEEQNSFYIVFTDMSYAPPYRLENLTKTRFKVAQVKSRQDDFDHVNPFQPLSFAWSYPLEPKLLRISLCQLDSQEELGVFSIDTISKIERITMRDRKRRREFVLEITNEKTMKVVRIIYPTQTQYEDEATQNLLVDDQTAQMEAKMSKLKLKINRLGLSVINSQAREICYTSVFNLRFSQESTTKHQKVALKAQDLQIDNQLCRQPDAIILKREQTMLGHGDFLQIKFHFVKNQAIENLLYYKYFIVSIVPFELNLDGNFCDETYKYILDVFHLASKFTSRAQLSSAANQALLGEITADPTAIKQPALLTEVGDEVSKIKSAFKDLQKKGQPYMETQRDVKKIYIEQFQIAEIRLKFTFSSSPILFREFTMNPTLKFFLVLLSNLKNVKLRFSKYHLQNQHMLVSIFTAQLKRFYWQECCNHKQLFKIVSSMGIFGSISTTITGISTALKSLIQRPFLTYHEENTLKAILLGSVVFVKDSLYVLSGSVGSIYDTLCNGFSVLVAYGLKNEEAIDMVVDRDLFEDDIEQAQRGITSFSTPLTAVDTQNRIWLKILMREKQHFDDKKRIIMRKQLNKIDDEAENNLTESAITSGTQAQYIIDSKRAARNQGMIYNLAYYTAQGVLFLPKRILNTGAFFVNSFIPDDIGRGRTSMQTKVRPPRFVSFTMELEPYSKKKAFALEILNDINLNVFETETIQKLYTMNAHVVIITGKRIICVDEHSSKKEKPSQKLFSSIDKLLPQGVRRTVANAQADPNDGQNQHDCPPDAENQPRGPGDVNDGARATTNLRQSISAEENQGIDITNSAGFTPQNNSGDSNIVYKHWNVFFKDIFRVSIDIVDRETNKVISQTDLEHLIQAQGDQSNNREARAAGANVAAGDGQPAHGQAQEGGANPQLKVYFVLKIYYQEQQNEGKDDGMEGGRRSSRSAKGRKGGSDGGLLGGLSGLKVGRKEIITKEWKVMRRVYTAIQNYSRRSTFM